MSSYAEERREWYAKHVGKGGARSASLGRATVGHLRMLKPYPWEPGHTLITIEGHMVRWEPAYDETILAQTSAPGASRADHAKVRAAIERAQRPGGMPGRRRVGSRRVPKTKGEWIVQGNYGYGHGWEDLTAHDDHAEARGILRDYRENEPQYPHRLIQRRVPRETGRSRRRGLVLLSARTRPSLRALLRRRR